MMSKFKAWIGRWWPAVAAVVAALAAAVVAVVTRRRPPPATPLADAPPAPRIELGAQPRVDTRRADDYHDLAARVDAGRAADGESLADALNKKFGDG